MGTIQGFCASNQARAICALVTPFCRGDLAEHIDERLVGLAVLFIKTRHHVAEVRFVKGGVCVDGSSQKTFAERAEGDEADSQLFERGQDLLLRLAPPE